MKVIFLDIDGVLNCHRTCFAFGGIPHTTLRNGRAGLDEVAIRLIGGIARSAGAVIVLSSTWRKHSDWLHYGPDLGLPIVDRTPSLAGIRGDEIQDWLDRHPGVERFAIIDDDSDMLETQKPFFVHTSGMNGFTWENAVQLAELLGVSIYDVNHPRDAVRRDNSNLYWVGA